VPKVRPAKRVAPKAEEVDFENDEDMEDVAAEDGDAFEDERPSRLALAVGALSHVTLSLAGSVRRMAARRMGRGSARRLYDHAFAPGDGLVRGRHEPRLDGALPDEDMGYDDMEVEAPDMDAEPMPAPAPQARKPKRNAAPPEKTRTRRAPARIADVETFELPPLELLAQPKGPDKKAAISAAALEQNARILEGVLDDFGVRGQIVNVRPGPVVTLYELEPAPGIKSARVIGLADDIARSMSAIACRVAVIPGKNAIGIELPNARRETVYLRELLAAEDFDKSKARLGLALGKTIGGEPVIADLTRMPHLLVAGTTGSGKSVSINTMILSLLYRMTPADCRMIMIDPKMLELSIYDGIPHLLTPVVTDPKQAVVALKWTVREMEDRYRKMSKLGVRNIDGYNQRLAQAEAKGETLTRTVQTGFDQHTGEAIYEQEELSFDRMPYIVVIIDEMADLMMVAGKEIEGAVQRLAQMARAAGIHVVMATQRPSVDVITGTIKANFPTRISFQVTSKIDSRTILGEQGAEQLLGQGDMLFMAGGGRIQRVHGPFVSDQEVEEVVQHLKAQGTPEYLEAITASDDDEIDADNYEQIAAGEESNDLYDKAVAIVLRDRKASTSYIQRRLAVGYNKAASLIEKMEKEGVVGPANHAGKREILVPGDEEQGFR
jgi:S-DNA-T family DNA segregation ATPase FtsK/SpoIIIE